MQALRFPSRSGAGDDPVGIAGAPAPAADPADRAVVFSAEAAVATESDPGRFSRRTLAPSRSPICQSPEHSTTHRQVTGTFRSVRSPGTSPDCAVVTAIDGAALVYANQDIKRGFLWTGTRQDRSEAEGGARPRPVTATMPTDPATPWPPSCPQRDLARTPAGRGMRYEPLAGGMMGALLMSPMLLPSGSRVAHIRSSDGPSRWIRCGGSPNTTPLSSSAATAAWMSGTRK